MGRYVPPFQGKRFAKKAEKTYYELVGVGYCSGREDDNNIEKIRKAIEGARRSPVPRKRKG